MKGSFSWRSWRGTKNFSTAPGLPMSRTSCTTLLVSTKRTAALTWRGPDHCSRMCYPSAHPRTCYPSAHSERAIQVHTQERAIQVHTQERAIQVHTQNVLSKCTPKNVLSKCTLRTCYPSTWYTRVLLVHHQSRAPLVLVHLSCITYTRAPISCTSTLVHPTRAHLVYHQYRVPNSCITHTRAPISCTSTLEIGRAHV